METIARLQWKAILAGVATVFLVGFLIPIVFMGLITLFPGVYWLQSMFAWLIDDVAGRGVTIMVIVASAFGVSYRVASRDKLLNGCLGAVAYIVGFYVLTAILTSVF